MEHIHVPWLLFSCGFKHKRPGEHWVAKSGMRLSGFGKHGTPFGRARLVLLVLAEKAAQTGRFIELSGAEIQKMFGLGWRPKNLEEHIHRVLDCVYEMVEERCSCPDGRCRPKCARSVPFITKSSYCVKDKTFRIELRDEFVEDTRQSPLASVDVVKALLDADQLAALDLYCWYQWKLFHKDHEAVDPLEPDGPFGLLPIARDKHKAYSDVRKLHRVIRTVWPGCPFRVVGTRKRRRIVYGPKPLPVASVPAGAAPRRLFRKPTKAVSRSTATGASAVLRNRRQPEMQRPQRPEATRSTADPPVPPLRPLPPLPPVRSLDELRQEAERMEARLQALAASQSRGGPSR